MRLFVQLNRPDGASPFVLMTTFPRKVFTEEDMSKPLAELGMHWFFTLAIQISLIIKNYIKLPKIIIILNCL